MNLPRRLPLVSPSTRKFFNAARRTSGFSLLHWLHGYVYGRWPYTYISIGTGEHWLAGPLKRIALAVNRLGVAALDPRKSPARATFADTYHGKVVTLEGARQLVRVERDIELRDLENVIPYTLARDIVLRDPDHIVVMDCPCRASRPDPCLPMDVCIIVGEPFASFVLEHHRARSRAITPGEAEHIISDEHARGHVQHAFFKDAMLGRFYAICNCCGCCCGALGAHHHGIPMLASSGYVCQVDAGLCIECGTCATSCQFGAIASGDGPVVVDALLCMGCGVCVDLCPQGALHLERDPGKPAPLEIERLLTMVSESNHLEVGAL